MNHSLCEIFTTQQVQMINGDDDDDGGDFELLDIIPSLAGLFLFQKDN